MKDKILNILKANRSEWTSGADICRRLAVSRTAIWKNIKNLKQAGYNIETQHRLGYRLVEIPDFLYPAEITAGLATKCLGQQVIHYHQENSTNEAAKKLARQGAEQGTVVVAEQQSSGKGRMGRHWHSAAGADVLFSIILYPEISLAEIPQIIGPFNARLNRTDFFNRFSDSYHCQHTDLRYFSQANLWV